MLKNIWLRLWSWFLGLPAYIQQDDEDSGPEAFYDRNGRLIAVKAMNDQEIPDEFGLVASDYERAGVALPKRTQQAALHYNHPDGRHASLLIYDHEIDLLFDVVNENRRKRRIP
jgi:hypothetical protein